MPLVLRESYNPMHQSWGHGRDAFAAAPLNQRELWDVNYTLDAAEKLTNRCLEMGGIVVSTLPQDMGEVCKVELGYELSHGLLDIPKEDTTGITDLIFFWKVNCSLIFACEICREQENY